MEDSPNDETMLAKAQRVNNDHVKKVLTAHFGVDSTNYDKKKALQALTHSNGVGIYKDTLLSDHKTGDPNSGSPKKGSEYTEVMTTRQRPKGGAKARTPMSRK